MEQLDALDKTGRLGAEWRVAVDDVEPAHAVVEHGLEQRADGPQTIGAPCEQFLVLGDEVAVRHEQREHARAERGNVARRVVVLPRGSGN